MIERSPHYRKRYGAWAGDPAGHPPDYTRCCAEVSSREVWSRSHQCSKPRGHGPDEAYCKQHDPVAVKARRAFSEVRSQNKWNARRYEIYGRMFFEVLVKIANGHNNAIGLARETIERFESRDHQPKEENDVSSKF